MTPQFIPTVNAVVIFAQINNISAPDAERVISTFTRDMTRPLTKEELISCISSWRDCTKAIITNATSAGRDS